MSKRVRALLAGGLVLGVGAAITLAAWTDSEFATGTFSAGSFNLEGTTDNSAWAEHATSGTAGTLAFSLNPTSLAPGDTVFAPFAVRLDAETTDPASVAITVAGTSDVVTNLTYELVQPAAWGCDVSSTGTSLVTAGTAVTAVAGPAAFALTEGADADAGAPAYLCFKVTAGDDLVQGQSGTVTWQFAATSTTP